MARRACGIESGRELVEEDDFGIVDQRERHEQPLPLAARERHEPRVALRRQPQLLEERVAVDGVLVQRCPEIDRFTNGDPLLELRRLQLDADAALERAPIPHRIEP